MLKEEKAEKQIGMYFLTVIIVILIVHNALLVITVLVGFLINVVQNNFGEQIMASLVHQVDGLKRMIVVNIRFHMLVHHEDHFLVEV